MAPEAKSDNLFKSLEEKIEIAKKICEIYSTGKYTIDSVCSTQGVPVRTFYQWRSEITEIADLVRKAKGKRRDERKGELVELAETALHKRLNGWPVEETIIEGGMTPEGEMQRKRMRKTRKVVPPDSTLIIYALKIGNPAKYVQSDIPPEDEGKETMYDFSKLTPDEIKIFERLVDKLGK